MKTLKLLPLVCIAFLVTIRTANAQLDPKFQSLIVQFSREINAALQNDAVNGSLSVAIIKNDKVIWLGAFGYADYGNNRLADTTTIYRIGSITKTFTATLLMQLVEEGKIKLDDPVEKYVPEIQKLNGYKHNGPLTFRELASHTAGLVREPDVRDAKVGSVNDWQHKLIDCIPYTSFKSKPGQQFLYSNIGYAILGLALERVTGEPYLKMIQNRILKPLHMKDTFFELPVNKSDRLALGLYNEKGTVNTSLPLRELKGRGYRVPNGGLFSTPKDLAKFVMSLMGISPLLSKYSMAEMQQVPNGGHNYGLGLMLNNNANQNIIGHNGSVPGYTSEYMIDLDSGYAVVFMRNYNVGSINLTRTAYSLLIQLKTVE
jgi:CubicO group peptidase (beta-lactamase class C family)